MILIGAAAILSCGLNAMPDGTPAPQGLIAAVKAPISDELARSLAAKVSPKATWTFAGEPLETFEWQVGLPKNSDGRVMIVRLTSEFLTYGARIGWVDVEANGVRRFTQTAKGTCQVNAADEPLSETGK